MATKAVYGKNGDRKGFVSRDKREDGRTRYGIGIDNVGSPYRGILDREINTPLGKIDYGYDGDTVAAGYTPPALKSMDYSYPNGEYHSRYVDNIAGMYPEVYSHLHNGQQSYGTSIEGFPAYGNGWNTYNTPLGTVRTGLSDDQVLGAEVTPNYYVQALANLLMGR